VPIRALIVGWVPMMWAVLHAIDRLADGCDVWHFSAPYPYRWMPRRRDTATPAPSSGRRAVRHDTEDRATLGGQGKTGHLSTLQNRPFPV